MMMPLMALITVSRRQWLAGGFEGSMADSGIPWHFAFLCFLWQGFADVDVIFFSMNWLQSRGFHGWLKSHVESFLPFRHGLKCFNHLCYMLHDSLTFIDDGMIFPWFSRWFVRQAIHPSSWFPSCQICRRWWKPLGKDSEGCINLTNRVNIKQRFANGNGLSVLARF